MRSGRLRDAAALLGIGCGRMVLLLIPSLQPEGTEGFQRATGKPFGRLRRGGIPALQQR